MTETLPPDLPPLNFEPIKNELLSSGKLIQAILPSFVNLGKSLEVQTQILRDIQAKLESMPTTPPPTTFEPGA